MRHLLAFLALASSTFAQVPNSLTNAVARYRLAADAIDSARGNNGTIFGSPAFTGGSPVTGNAVRFTANTQSISASSTPAVASLSNNFAVSLWMKMAVYNPSAASTVAQKVTVGTNGWMLWVGEASAPTNLVFFTYGTSPNNQSSLGYTVPLNRWVFIVCQLTGSRSQTWANGRLVRDVAITGSATTNTKPFIIGNYAGVGDSFKGQLCDVNIYPYSLSPQTIGWLYTFKPYQ